MTLTDLISLFETGSAVFSELKANGTLAEIEKAEATIETVVTDAKVQALIAQIKNVAKEL